MLRRSISNLRKLKRIFLTLVFTIAMPLLVAEAYVSPGTPTGMVNDFASIIDPAIEVSIESKLSELRKNTGVEIAVVTVNNIDGETIETFANKLFEDWGIGDKEKDNGLLILVAPNEREVRIEVGYGMEGVITDLQSGNIIEKDMLPAFRNGSYASGIETAVDTILAVINGSPEAIAYVSSVDANGSNSEFSFSDISEFAIFMIFMVTNVLAFLLGKTKSWWLGGVIGAVVGAIIGFLFIRVMETGLLLTIGLTILGLLADFYFSKTHHTRFKNGRWGGFGGFSGGSSGGGGFGGFSGGSSGGGGASGRW